MQFLNPFASIATFKGNLRHAVLPIRQRPIRVRSSHPGNSRSELLRLDSKEQGQR